MDGSGNVFVSDGEIMELGAVDFGTVAIGQTSAAIPLTFTFDSGGTISSPVALTQGAAGLDFTVASGGTCTAGTSYSTGNTCTVNVTFTPKFAGLRNGAVLLQDGSGNTIATGYVHGIGSGPQVSFLPGSQDTLGGGFSDFTGVAVDGSGNVFVADYGNNAVNEIPSRLRYLHCVKTLGGGFTYPYGVAVDGSGNVFVADTGNNAVKEILAAGATPRSRRWAAASTCPLAWRWTGAATSSSPIRQQRGAGDSGGGRLHHGQDVGQRLLRPTGVAVDGSGNVFVADTGNDAVKEILAVLAVTATTHQHVGQRLRLAPMALRWTGAGTSSSPIRGQQCGERDSGGGRLTPRSRRWAAALTSQGRCGGRERERLRRRYRQLPRGEAGLRGRTEPDFATPTPVGTTDTTDGPQTVTI